MKAHWLTHTTHSEQYHKSGTAMTNLAYLRGKRRHDCYAINASTACACRLMKRHIRWFSSGRDGLIGATIALGVAARRKAPAAKWKRRA